jgi:folate-dependent tRNA-U54 methylase TrmFO/GidA
MTTEVEKAEATIKSLEDKRQHLVQKATELDREQQLISFAAHTGDAKARTRLTEINSAVATHSAEMKSIEAALIEATARAQVARAGEALAADRAQALQLREKSARFR